MPLRELLFGASVATVVPTTFLVGTTWATSLHIVETVLRTRLLGTRTYRYTLECLYVRERNGREREAAQSFAIELDPVAAALLREI